MRSIELIRRPDQLSQSGEVVVSFEGESRPGFVSKAITILLSSKFKLLRIEFYDTDLGIIRWLAGRGLGKAYGWENDDEQEHGRHFPCSFLSDGNNPRLPLPFLGSVDDFLWESVIRNALAEPEVDHIISGRLLSAFIPSSTTPRQVA